MKITWVAEPGQKIYVQIHQNIFNDEGALIGHVKLGTVKLKEVKVRKRRKTGVYRAIVK